MGWEGFAFFFPAAFVTIATIGLGSLFLLMAWAEIDRVSATRENVKKPSALYAFMSAVFLDLIGLCALWLIPRDLRNSEVAGVPLAHLVWTLFLSSSFVSVIISMVLARRSGEPAKGAVQNGARALFIVDLLGFVWFVAG
jgi:Kef-type K+ transport system membrane component KefB